MTTLENIISNAASAAYAAGSAVNTGARLAYRGAKRVGRSVRRTRRSRTTTFTRTVAPGYWTLTAGVFSGSLDVALSGVQTSDLIAMYDQYKINYVDLHIMPRFDPAQSGVTNNAQCFGAFACDPTGQVTTPTWIQVTAFANAKVAPLVAGRSVRYRFRPRVINTLSGGNYSVNTSDWLVCSAAGVALPHLRLLANITSTLTTDTNGFDYVLSINFTVKDAS